MKNLYAKQHVLKKLRYHNQPHSNMTFMRYEKLGIIPEPDYIIEFEDRVWELYTAESLDKIVEAVKKYRKTFKFKKCSIKSCDENHYARGFCIKHYYIAKRALRLNKNDNQ